MPKNNVQLHVVQDDVKQPRMELITITPELATEWLEQNTSNRVPNSAIVERYAQAMKAGKWQLNGDAIRFSINDVLLDGQQRLMAIVKSGETIQSFVAYNLPPESFQTVDRGRKRSLADDLSVQGEANRFVLASALNMYFHWLKGDLLGTKRPTYVTATSSEALLELLSKNPGLRYAVTRCASQAFRKIATSSLLAFVYHALSQLDAVQAEAFFTQLETGIELTAKDPVYILREKLMSMRASGVEMRRDEVTALIFKAWNAKR